MNKKKMGTCLSCMDPMSPSPSSNSMSSESQKGVEPSFTWKAMFFPPYLHAVLVHIHTEPISFSTKKEKQVT
jgi:hypothetical protein